MPIGRLRCIVAGMMRPALVAGLLVASPVLAQDFPYRGQWEIRDPSNYVAIVLIDGERRATWDAPKDQGRAAIFRGHVADVTARQLVFHLTDGAIVTKTYCDIRARDLMHCYIIRANGSRSENFLLIKVGPGPEHLTPSPSRN